MNKLWRVKAALQRNNHIPGREPSRVLTFILRLKTVNKISLEMRTMRVSTCASLNFLQLMNQCKVLIQLSSKMVSGNYSQNPHVIRPSWCSDNSHQFSISNDRRSKTNLQAFIKPGRVHRANNHDPAAYQRLPLLYQLFCK